MQCPQKVNMCVGVCVSERVSRSCTMRAHDPGMVNFTHYTHTPTHAASENISKYRFHERVETLNGDFSLRVLLVEVV